MLSVLQHPGGGTVYLPSLQEFLSGDAVSGRQGLAEELAGPPRGHETVEAVDDRAGGLIPASRLPVTNRRSMSVRLVRAGARGGKNEEGKGKVARLAAVRKEQNRAKDFYLFSLLVGAASEKTKHRRAHNLGSPPRRCASHRRGGASTSIKHKQKSPHQIAPHVPLNGNCRAPSTSVSCGLVHVPHPGDHRGTPDGTGVQAVRLAGRSRVRLPPRSFERREPQGTAGDNRGQQGTAGGGGGGNVRRSVSTKEGTILQNQQ